MDAQIADVSFARFWNAIAKPVLSWVPAGCVTMACPFSKPTTPKIMPRAYRFGYFTLDLSKTI